MAEQEPRLFNKLTDPTIIIAVATAIFAIISAYFTLTFTINSVERVQTEQQETIRSIQLSIANLETAMQTRADVESGRTDALKEDLAVLRAQLDGIVVRGSLQGDKK